MNKKILTVLLCFAFFTGFSQQERRNVRQGNRNYKKERYLESEIKYKQALDINGSLTEANFNLGDAFYKQKKYELAAGQFELATGKSTNKNIKSMSFHNLGNTYLQMYQAAADTQPNSPYLDKAINAYKNALRINPADMDTKYNLTYALKLKKKTQGQNQKKQQNKQNQKKDQKDKNKQDQQKEQQQNQKKQQDQQKEQQQNQKKQQEQQKEQKQQLTKDESDKLLKALQNEEKKTQNKILKNQQRPVRVKIEKDW